MLFCFQSISVSSLAMCPSPSQVLPTITTEQVLVRFNVLFAHLFSALAGSQGMSAMVIKPSRSLTIKALLDGSFPAIKSTDDTPTPYVSIATVGYIAP